MASSSSSSSQHTQLKALIVGATGATGSALLSLLSAEPRFRSITSLVRKAPAETLERVTATTVDFDKLADSAAAFAGVDVVFCCLGTTRKVAGADGFVKVDHDYVMATADLAKKADVKHFSIVSSQGADSSSMFLYMSTKGKVEDKLKALQFPRLTIMQPGLLHRPDSDRLMEKVASWVMPSLPVSTLARAMMRDALSQADQPPQAPAVTVLSNSQIKKLGAPPAAPSS